jgi:hypothetical protein
MIAQTVAELLADHVRLTVEQYTSQLAELSTQLGATQEAVRTMRHIAGEDDVPAERWRDALIAIATRFRARRQALDRPANDDSETGELRRRAVSALDTGAPRPGDFAIPRARTRGGVLSGWATRHSGTLN